MKKLFVLTWTFLFISISAFQLSAQTLIPTLGTIRIMQEDIMGLNGQNTTANRGQSWNDMNDNFNAPTRLHDLSLGSLRYPGGTIANYWNWRDGIFLKDYELPTGIKLASEFKSYTPFTSGENDFKSYAFSIKGANCRPLWVWNIMSSDFNFQLASLYGARSQGLSKNTVEFGNEFYLGITNNSKAFREATDYIKTSIEWSTQLHQIAPFSDVKVGVVGATILPGSSQRRNLWLDRVLAQSSNMNDITNISLHVYIGNGMNKSSSICLNNNAVYTNEVLRNGLARAFKQVAELKNDEFQRVKRANKEIWLTEYNMSDKTHPTHGSWFHALFTSSMTLAFLEEPSVSKLMPHALVGNSVFAGIFPSITPNNLNAFDNLGQFTSPIDFGCSSPQSREWEFSALGSAISYLGKAMKNSTSAYPLDFGVGTNELSINGQVPGYKDIYGWRFDKANGSDIIIINYGSTYTLNLTNILPILPGFDFSYNYLKGDLAEYPQGNALTIAGQPNELETMANYGLLSNPSAFDVNGYTIYHFKIEKYIPQVIVLNDELCCNQSTSVMAYGIDSTAGWHWTINDVEAGTENPLMVNSIPVQETGSLVVKLLNTTNEMVWQQAIVLNPCPTPPTILVDGIQPTNDLVEFCPNANPSFTLSTNWTSSNNLDYSFIWTPSFGVNAVRSASTLVFPENTTTYQLFVTDGVCWQESNKVLFQSTKPEGISLTDTIEMCLNIENNLQLEVQSPVGSNYTYQWFKEQSLVANSAIYSEIGVSSSSNYWVEVNNSNNSCADTLYTYVGARNCCLAPNLNANDQVIPTILNGYSANVNDLAEQAIALGGFSVIYSTVVNITAVTNNTLYINGELEITKDLTITNCSVQFGENACLKLTKGVRLTLNGTELVRCDGQLVAWKGVIADVENQEIVINGGSSNGVTISGAHTALNLSDDVPFSISNAIFQDNLQSIYLHEYKSKVKLPSDFSTNLSPIIGSQFVRSTNLFPEPFLGVNINFSRAHIILENVAGIDIGETTLGENNFREANTGILSKNSSFSLQHNSFENMISYLSVSDKSTVGLGFGVYTSDTYADNGHEVIIGDVNATTSSNSFVSCPTSIGLIDELSGTIDNNYFGGGVTNDFDIKFQNNVESAISIKENDFHEVQVGIYGYNLGRLTDVEIIGNTFTDPSTTIGNPNFEHTAITLQNSYKVSPAKLIVDNNEINNLRIGIHSSGLSGFRIHNNTINFNLVNLPSFGSYFRGIWIAPGNNGSIIENTISNAAFYNYMSDELVGINIDNSLGNEVGCNNLNKLGFSMQFKGNCNPTLLKNNVITDFNRGIDYVNSNIGNQGAASKPADNKWILSSGLPPYTGGSRLDVGGSLLTSTFDVWYHRDPTFSSSDFSPSPFNPNVISAQGNQIGATPICSTGGDELQFNLSIVEQAIENDLSYAEQPAQNNYHEKVMRYEELKRNEVALDTVIAQSVLIFDFINETAENNIGLQFNINKLISEKEKSSIENVLFSVVDTNMHEANLKIAQTLVNKQINGLNLNSLDSNQLNDIAEQGTLEGGEAVFLSRSFLFKEVHPANSSGARIKQKNNFENFNINIQPNPSCDWIQLISKCDFSFLKIYDQLGKLVINHKLTPVKTKKLNISHLPIGNYLIIIQDEIGVRVGAARFIKVNK